MTEEPTPDEIEAIFDQFGDVLGDLFGGTAAKGGADVRMELELDSDDLARGMRRVTIERFTACEGCHGSGREPASDPCPSCDGKGRLMESKGMFQLSRTCDDCRGSGSARECARCSGQRGETHEEILKVTIPPGIRDGQILRLKGKGSDRSDGEGAGDLYLAVRIPGARAPTIPVRETGGSSLGPWIALGVAVFAIMVAALLLR